MTTRVALHGVVAGLALLMAGCDVPTESAPTTDAPGIDLGRPDPAPDPAPPEDDGLPEDHAPNCGTESVALELATPQLMLVLDKSGSMAANTWDHDRDASTPEVTRWASLHTVVTDVTETFDGQMDLGAVLFPALGTPNVSNAQACTMAAEPDAPVGPDTAAILQALPPASATDIYGGTPATAGLRLATEHLRDAQRDEPQAIVLVTDGAANCAAGAMGSGLFLQYDDALPLAAAEAHALGIPVYVVGIDIEDDVLDLPVANPWERLSEVAEYGGVPRPGDVPFYDVFDEQELDVALGSIAQEVSCTLALPTTFDPDRTAVTIDGTSVPHRSTCDDGDGWTMDDAGALRLCADACQAAQLAQHVEATQSCIPEG